MQTEKTTADAVINKMKVNDNKHIFLKLLKKNLHITTLIPSIFFKRYSIGYFYNLCTEYFIRKLCVNSVLL